jgi:hypothetical protein
VLKATYVHRCRRNSPQQHDASSQPSAVGLQEPRKHAMSATDCWHLRRVKSPLRNFGHVHRVGSFAPAPSRPQLGSPTIDKNRLSFNYLELLTKGTSCALKSVLMSPLAPLLSLSLSLLSALAVGCTDAQSYTPISDDNLDELCEQSTVTLSDDTQIAVEFDGQGQASYEGSLDVTLFTSTEMRVDNQELIFSIPGGAIASVDVGEGTWDFFTSMVFSVDVREAGATEWQALSIATNFYDIFWFTDVEINGSTTVFNGTTLTLCTVSEREINGAEIPFDVSSDYELRIRVFPFDGAGDLVGTYDYSVDVTLR